jgi:hypothetical protein
MAKYFFILFFAILSGSASAQDTLSITLENVKYPHPVRLLNLKSEGQDFRMAYMDVHLVSPNGRTVILFHRKNLGGYYWADVIRGAQRQRLPRCGTRPGGFWQIVQAVYPL